MKSLIWMQMVMSVLAVTAGELPQPDVCFHPQPASCRAHWQNERRQLASQQSVAETYWRRLTSTQRQAWQTWAMTNTVVLEDGIARRVNGIQALGIVLRNRALAGEPANPASPPTAARWLGPVLSLRDAGPFTDNAGFVGFRVESELREETKWFIWATPPLEASANDTECFLNFVTCLTLPPSAFDELTPTIGPQFELANGSWDGPDLEGDWTTDKFVWFRVHQYADGQLGPGVLLRGRIQVKL
jgi:hypothetical protein